MDEKQKNGEENLNTEPENSTCSNKGEENQNYYYDDSTGYEIYNPDEDDEDDKE